MKGDSDIIQKLALMHMENIVMKALVSQRAIKNNIVIVSTRRNVVS